MRRGFTLTELIVTLGVLAVIVVTALAFGLNLRPRIDNQNLTSTVAQITALLRKAQSRTVSQAGGVAWGVRFDNTNPITPTYALFSGSYSSSSIQDFVTMPAGICYSPASIDQGTFLDVLFTPISGQATSASITVVLSNDCRWASGDIASWKTTTPLPHFIANQAATAYNNYLYSLGGFNTSILTSEINYAPINGNGTLSAWTQNPAGLPPSAGREAQAVTAYNNYLYVVGGVDQTYNLTNAVWYATINSDGSLSNWTQATSSLPVPLQNAPALSYQGYMYILGGYTNLAATTYTSNALYAKIGSDGGLGPWQSTSFIPNEVTYLPATIYRGMVYSLGGYSNGVAYVPAPAYALINPNGSLASWTTQTTTINFGQPAVAFNYYLYSIGGVVGGVTPTSTITFAKLNGNGSLASWSQTSGNFPSVILSQPFVGYGGMIYSIGGTIGQSGNLTSTVFYTSLFNIKNSGTVTVSSQGKISN